MFEIAAAEMVEKVQEEMLAEEIVVRQAFYADEEIWQHEFCGTECDGQPHV